MSDTTVTPGQHASLTQAKAEAIVVIGSNRATGTMDSQSTNCGGRLVGPTRWQGGGAVMWDVGLAGLHAPRRPRGLPDEHNSSTLH